MNHALKYTTLVPAKAPLGESTFAAARREIEARYGVSPTEVFLDGIQVEGVVRAGEYEIDLDALHLRIVTFGADAPVVPVTPTALLEQPAILDEDEADESTAFLASTSTTTTTA